MSGYQSVAQVQALTTDPTNAFVIVKATQGLAYVSSGWPTRRDAAGDKFVGAYHYCEPGHLALDEADHFLTTVGPDVPFMALDVEAAVTPDFVLSWLDQVKARTGRTPAVYTNWAWLPKLRTACTVEQWEGLVEYPLWLAEIAPVGKHSSVDPKPGSGKSWPVLVHQYAYTPDSTGAQVDRDWTGDLARLRGAS
ncbi:glycoside hydrolase family 25 protein [Terrabacter terrigena]|uniref:Glycoside hydrolase family 25 protein n=1 Tax=Terrabacter terrigena TaxID=574718 RepID=A0ABW3MYV4_9MICO